jgi:hypothetical protein
MIGGDPAGEGVIAPRNGGEQLTVLACHLVRTSSALKRCPGRHHELVPEPVEHLQRDRVA